MITQKHGSNYRYSSIYSLLNPPGGQTGTDTVNFSASVSAGIVAGAANFAGVNQTTPLGTPGGAYSQSNDTTPTVTLSGLAGTELVFDNVFQGGSPPSDISVGAGQTPLWNAKISNTRGAASTEQATGSSVTMSWTAASSSMWVTTAVPINPAWVEPTFALTMAVDPSGGGTTIPSVGVYSYPEDDVVDISPLR